MPKPIARLTLLGAMLALAMPAAGQQADRHGRSGERGDPEPQRIRTAEPRSPRPAPEPPLPRPAPEAAAPRPAREPFVQGPAPEARAAPAIAADPTPAPTPSPRYNAPAAGRPGEPARNQAAIARQPPPRWDTDIARGSTTLEERRRNATDDRTPNDDGRERDRAEYNRNDGDRDARDSSNARADRDHYWYRHGWDDRWSRGRYDPYGRLHGWDRYRRYDWRFGYDPRFFFGAPWIWDRYWTFNPWWWRPFGYYDWNRYGYAYGYGVRAEDLVRSDPIIARWALVGFDRDRSGYLGPNETEDAARELRRLADLNGDRRISDREYRYALDRLRSYAYRGF